MGPTDQQRAGAVLAKLRQLAGAPNHDALMAQNAKSNVAEISRGTYYALLKGTSKPRVATLTAFVVLCLDYARAHPRTARLRPEQYNTDYWLECYHAVVSRPVASSGEHVGMPPAPATGFVPMPLTARGRLLTYARSLLPPALLDREAELETVKTFSQGPEGYLVWEGEPWAGKSALAASVVTNPPAGSVVVGFFVVDRLSDRSNSRRYVKALASQLSEIAHIAQPEKPTPDDLQPLLELAAARLRSSGLTLLLVVDALDEDQGNRHGSRRESIASILPAQLPQGCRVLVTSRLHPPLPRDVPDNHPLRTVDRRQLTPSSAGADNRRSAELEIGHRLASRKNGHADVLLLLAATSSSQGTTSIASSDGLTSADIADILELSHHRVAKLLDSGYASTVQTAAAPYLGEQPVYFLAHQTLAAEIARQAGAAGLAHARQKLKAWADRWRSREWPRGTPLFLLRSYCSLLAGLEDWDAVYDLVVDRDRHSRSRTSLGSSYWVLQELDQACRHYRRVNDLERLVTVAVLASHHRKLGHRVNSEIALAHAALGRYQLAEDLARTLHEWDREACLALLALTPGGPLDWRMTIARTLEPSYRVDVMASLVAELSAEQRDAATEIWSEVQGDRPFLAAESTMSDALVQAAAAMDDLDILRRSAKDLRQVSNLGLIQAAAVALRHGDVVIAETFLVALSPSRFPYSDDDDMLKASTFLAEIAVRTGRTGWLKKRAEIQSEVGWVCLLMGIAAQQATDLETSDDTLRFLSRLRDELEADESRPGWHVQLARLARQLGHDAWAADFLYDYLYDDKLYDGERGVLWVGDHECALLSEVVWQIPGADRRENALRHLWVLYGTKWGFSAAAFDAWMQASWRSGAQDWVLRAARSNADLLAVAAFACLARHAAAAGESGKGAALAREAQQRLDHLRDSPAIRSESLDNMWSTVQSWTVLGLALSGEIRAAEDQASWGDTGTLVLGQAAVEAAGFDQVLAEQLTECAQSVADASEPDGPDDRLLAEVARHFLRESRLDDAVRLAAYIQSHDRDRVLAEVAQEYLRLGDQSAAMRATATMLGGFLPTELEKTVTAVIVANPSADVVQWAFALSPETDNDRVTDGYVKAIFDGVRAGGARKDAEEILDTLRYEHNRQPARAALLKDDIRAGQLDAAYAGLDELSDPEQIIDVVCELLTHDDIEAFDIDRLWRQASAAMRRINPEYYRRDELASLLARAALTHEQIDLALDWAQDVTSDWTRIKLEVDISLATARPRGAHIRQDLADRIKNPESLCYFFTYCAQHNVDPGWHHWLTRATERLDDATVVRWIAADVIASASLHAAPEFAEAAMAKLTWDDITALSDHYRGPAARADEAELRSVLAALDVHVETCLRNGAEVPHDVAIRYYLPRDVATAAAVAHHDDVERALRLRVVQQSVTTHQQAETYELLLDLVQEDIRDCLAPIFAHDPRLADTAARVLREHAGAKTVPD